MRHVSFLLAVLIVAAISVPIAGPAQAQGRTSACTISGHADGLALQPLASKKASDPTVYVTRTGTKYHAAGCRSLRKSKIPMKLSEAKKQGYTACKICGG